MRVLVCGGRDYKDHKKLFDFLDDFHSKTPITVMIEGGANGADYLAATWADYKEGVAEKCFRADWNKHGKGAGSIRNQRMLDEGKPDVVIAFPGGNGTADMVKRARFAGVKVIEVK